MSKGRFGEYGGQGTSIIHPSTEGVFLLCNILDLLIYSL